MKHTSYPNPVVMMLLSISTAVPVAAQGDPSVVGAWDTPVAKRSILRAATPRT
jgi:hypothetical protein